jgi:hypothetical protein
MGVLELEPVTLHRKPFMNTGQNERYFLPVFENLRTLRGAAVRGMDPMPGTDTAAVGAGRHILGDREESIDRPNTLTVDAENCQIRGLDAVHVGRVCNGKGASLHVINTLKRKGINGLR